MGIKQTDLKQTDLKQTDLKFGKPRRKRGTITIPPLTEEPNDPKYEATDDDLPLVFWPEPDFDKESE